MLEFGLECWEKRYITKSKNVKNRWIKAKVKGGDLKFRKQNGVLCASLYYTHKNKKRHIDLSLIQQCKQAQRMLQRKRRR